VPDLDRQAAQDLRPDRQRRRLARAGELLEGFAVFAADDVALVERNAALSQQLARRRAGLAGAGDGVQGDRVLGRRLPQLEGKLGLRRLDRRAGTQRGDPALGLGRLAIGVGDLAVGAGDLELGRPSDATPRPRTSARAAGRRRRVEARQAGWSGEVMSVRH
jgi:hypothetical protein